jgi:hypothetical protein
MIVMAVTILGMAYIIGNQRETISRYKDNDFKYFYIKMQGQASEEMLQAENLIWICGKYQRNP